jgi:transposase-like protein
VKQTALDTGERTDGLTTEERDEQRRLRCEVRQLREERAILSTAAAWFARETNTIPSQGFEFVTARQSVRRGARPDSRGRGVLSACVEPALPRPPDPQSPERSPRVSDLL